MQKQIEPSGDPISPNNIFYLIKTRILKKIPLTKRTFLSKVALLSVILLLLYSLNLFLSLRQKDSLFKSRGIDYLAVISASPRGTTKSNKPKIIVKFNLPVTAHHIGDYFYINPYVKGNLKQGSSLEEIVFEPEVSLPRGAYVTVSLKTGLPSNYGKKLLSDYSFNFTVSHEANTVAFTSKEWSGKFMSFQALYGTDITLKVGSDISYPSVRIYKADVGLLLESLIYKVKDSNYRYPRQGEYIEKSVNTDKLKLIKEYKEVKDNDKINFKGEKGIYLFQALEGDLVTNSAWVSLNDIGIHLRQDDEKIFLAAQSLISGEPESGIDINFYKLEDEPKTLAIHTLSGIQEYPFTYPERLDLVIGKKGNEVIIIPVEIPNSQAEIQLTQSLNNKYQIFLYTDRPIYKSNAKVSFRGIVRKDNDALYKLPDVTKVRVYLGGDSSSKFDKEFDVSEEGIFYGEFDIPKDIANGTRYLYATTILDKQKYSSEGGYTYFDVFEYKKPVFGLEVEVDKSEYIRSEKILAKIKGKYFDGRAYADQSVNLTIYSRDYYETEKAVYNSSFKLNGWGGMCGAGGFEDYYGQKVGEPKEIQLDKNGEAQVEFSTKDLTSILSQEVTFLVQKKDENENNITAAKNAIVHQGQFNVFFRPGPNRISYNEEFTLAFYTENLGGEKLSEKEFSYEIFEESWGSSNKPSKREIIKSGNVKTDYNGIGLIKEKLETLESDDYLYISIKTLDSLNNVVEARKGIQFFKQGQNRYQNWGYNSIEQTVLKITSFSNSLKVGEPASLEVISPSDLVVFGSFERGRVYIPQWIKLSKGTNTFKFDVISDYSPSTTPTFSFFYNGEYFIEGLSLNVPALHKLIDVEISTDKEKYNPSDTAIITITTKDRAGNFISVDAGIGIVDEAIFALRKNAAAPLHSSFYYFRRRSINSSSSLTWIATYNWDGGGGGGGGFEAFLKDSDTLYWNPALKTGTDGQVKVEVPVGETETTWRVLVYASSDDTKVGQSSKDFLVSGQ
ncbi:hypothetical protein A2962_00660 [Candidatus Woesebacteria bacterium RIFCSPLOWO2_01_FULL_39_61]|uniref:Alpha-2-macroglobulin bait region domain-containing protein n=1 Tax=Candidatus Woesebacteria bacterium RIFCSPHIGHO2_02_FULL_39_13 TaxID=1802505 RepID=A0A1F7Z274_9BACT|nr:MAG: hypothetical protein A2692_04790 [Candidatus Woesebacteria bacterium RIFCSPHIGHO2_01_FULL_39_95]OGM33580.1 MAG: hypothetical protein A3D01_01335 [Candidatus Woesebacteria bacterium RIFCSPHIGHO2_02_FULL_39_13]OGM36690.1 MAG: hypothetical protein A3E13_00155 [Candidatus Woesebacteria bacterium RIFCSPHIGHO2_12_FULL_40_20]OGM68563.1 MAG: hypothetical protein A2962_00660 [Candidatus Woesebacteria bacterium RIFCSPLOWO2_01_FULL_39_61]OGM75034.1 MAG: hypothetical protein A3H19_02115 [Candidatus